MKTLARILPLFLVSAAACAQVPQLPVVTVTRDNVEIHRSCLIRIPDGTVIVDGDNNGVLHITRDDITVRFEDGSALVGSPADVTPDQYRGLGIRLAGHTGVTIENARVHGYRAGLYASDADGLTLAGGDYSNNYHPRLTSTPLREGGGDWMSPHRNDNNEWLNNYSAAVYIEDSNGITVRGVRIRKGQHGILLDRVNNSKIYDNDASFLSGWGLGLWRSSRNTITRNAFDFCVRGHSEGVYNRGQDSAGILFFEQCNDNVVAENSATHGGDGFFGFAGLEALGLPDTLNRDLDYRRLGCNDNIFLRNDLSYAPAHGLEMTFSFGNIIAENRFVENAICGVWGGMSQQTVIIHNEFKGNGGMAYGLERGGVNIEHSIDNLILENTFENNRVGVALWWDHPGDVDKWAWGKANYGPLTGNIIARNTFLISDAPQPFFNVGPDEKRIGVSLRDDSNEGRLAPVMLIDNTFRIVGRGGLDVQLLNGTQVVREGDVPSVTLPQVEILGETTPVGARAHLRGRHNIIMGEWGPWDHEGVFLRTVERSASRLVYEVFGAPEPLKVRVEGGGVKATVADADTLPGAQRVTFNSEPGAHRYEATLSAGDWSHRVSGTLLSARWQAVAFNWPQDADPREQLNRWLAAARSPQAVSFTTDSLLFPFGGGGPSDLQIAEQVTRARLAPDRFGIIARTRMPLTAGTWRITTVSDDGIRVSVDGDTVIDNWTWHAPTTDTAEITLDRNRTVHIELMYFELDGGATLTVDIERIE